jgi:hypothetical protein
MIEPRWFCHIEFAGKTWAVATLAHMQMPTMRNAMKRNIISSHAFATRCCRGYNL